MVCGKTEHGRGGYQSEGQLLNGTAQKQEKRWIFWKMSVNALMEFLLGICGTSTQDCQPINLNIQSAKKHGGEHSRSMRKAGCLPSQHQSKAELNYSRINVYGLHSHASRVFLFSDTFVFHFQGQIIYFDFRNMLQHEWKNIKEWLIYFCKRLFMHNICFQVVLYCVTLFNKERTLCKWNWGPVQQLLYKATFSSYESSSVLLKCVIFIPVSVKRRCTLVQSRCSLVQAFKL